MTHDLDDVCNRLEDIQAEIKESRNSRWDWAVIGWICLLLVIPDWAGAVWNSRFMISARYGTASDQVIIADKPHDCAFMKAPVGHKYCSYSRQITATTILHRHDTATGRPIISYDEGKNWDWNDSYTGPESTVRLVNVNWTREDE